MVNVPRIVGKSQADAEADLNEAGLEYTIEEETIITTLYQLDMLSVSLQVLEPPSKLGSVTVTISRGPEPDDSSSTPSSSSDPPLIQALRVKVAQKVIRN